MRRPKFVLAALCAVIAVVGVWALLSEHPVDRAPPKASVAGEPTCAVAALPHEVIDTMRRIQAGGPFPFPRNDGSVFGNYEGHLPKQGRGYYHEYTVPTPRARGRSVRRIVTGGTPLTHPPQYFYTGDHYDSFCLITDAGSRQ